MKPLASILASLLVAALPLSAAGQYAAPSSAAPAAPSAPSNAPVEPGQGNSLMGNLPSEFVGVGIDEKPGAVIDPNLTFVDSTGKTVRLSEYFTGNKPLILNLGYYDCPMLCDLVSRGLIKTLEDLDLNIYDDFDILTVSIDPRETPDLAEAKKAGFLAEYRRPSSNPRAGWHFLTGSQEAISNLARTVGYRYNYIENNGEFAHAAVLIILTPDGKVSRYLYGKEFPQRTMRLSLVEASEGKIGSLGDQILLFCFQFDHTAGKYSLAAMNIMRAGGAISVVALASVVVFLLYRENRRNKQALLTSAGRTPVQYT